MTGSSRVSEKLHFISRRKVPTENTVVHPMISISRDLPGRDLHLAELPVAAQIQRRTRRSSGYDKKRTQPCVIKSRWNGSQQKHWEMSTSAAVLSLATTDTLRDIKDIRTNVAHDPETKQPPNGVMCPPNVMPRQHDKGVWQCFQYKYTTYNSSLTGVCNHARYSNVC